MAPQKLNAVRCNTEAQAIAFASSMAGGRTEPMAVNAVNKASGSEVCGRNVGYAVVEIEKTANHRSSLFMLAALRFCRGRQACLDGELGHAVQRRQARAGRLGKLSSRSGIPPGPLRSFPGHARRRKSLPPGGRSYLSSHNLS